MDLDSFCPVSFNYSLRMGSNQGHTWQCLNDRNAEAMALKSQMWWKTVEWPPFQTTKPFQYTFSCLQVDVSPQKGLCVVKSFSVFDAFKSLHRYISLTLEQTSMAHRWLVILGWVVEDERTGDISWYLECATWGHFFQEVITGELVARFKKSSY